MPNTFKNYYFDAYSNEEFDNKLTIVESELSKPLKRANSNTNINKFFDDSKTKKQKKALASSVGQAREGGMSYVSTNVNATATHLIKLEVYDLKKLAKVPENKQWKHADVRIKFYTKTSNRIYEHSKQLIYNITKEVAESQDCKKYFFNDEP